MMQEQQEQKNSPTYHVLDEALQQMKPGSYLGSICLPIFVSIFILISLFGFYHTIRNRAAEMQERTLVDLASQGAVLVETRLKNHLDILRSISLSLEDKEELLAEENMDYLKRLMLQSHLGFQNLGLADLQGNASLTDGSQLQVKNLSFFQQALRDGYSISGSKSCIPTNKGETTFIVSVSVPDSVGKVRGVLYATIALQSVNLYQNTTIEDDNQYIQLIDQNGNYIFRENLSHPIVFDNNLFDGLKLVESTIPADTIIKQVKGGSPVLTEVDNGEEEFLAFFAPLSITDWCIVTVVNKVGISKNLHYLLGNNVYLLIIQVVIPILLLCAFLIRNLLREKKYFFGLYGQLQLNNQMTHIAVSGSSSVFLIYNYKQDELRIINRERLRLALPETVQNASHTLTAYLPETPGLSEMVQNIFAALEYEKGTLNYDFLLEISHSLRNYHICIKSLESRENTVNFFVGAVEDITEKVHMKKEIAVQGQLLSRMFGFLVVDLQNDIILYASEKIPFSSHSALPFQETIRNMIDQYVDASYRKELIESINIDFVLSQYENGIHKIVTEYRCFDRNGIPVWLECETNIEPDSETARPIAYLVLKNIDEQKHRELMLSERADRDFLTSLYNRGGGTEQINLFLENTASLIDKNSGIVHAFVILDLDNFKMLNDTLGHQTGDRAIQDIAEIMRQHFREYDILCRLAGDEFVVFLKNIPIDAIPRNLESLLKKLHLCYTENNRSVQVSASAGVALVPMHGCTFEELYNKADKALYSVKATGKADFHIYNDNL